MASTDLESFIRGLPKAELHLHIEGSLEPELLFELATRNGIDLPFADVEACRSAYSFTDLQSFLDIYFQGASALLTERDFYDLMAAYLRRAHDDGVRRAEIFFDPQTHTERGVGFDVFMSGFGRAITDAESELGISVGLIMCFLRHLPGSEAVATFEAARGYLDQLIGVGLDSSEVDHPPGEFAQAFTLARDAGLHLVAHAGEEGPPEYIVEALDILRVERIDHGVRCEEDAELVRRLVDSQMPLTVCPLSNLELAVVSRLEDHNLKRLMDQGILATVNSDDPAYFGGYIADNYLKTAIALELSTEELVTLARNSFNAAFVTEGQRAAWLAEIVAYLEEVQAP
ncbi:MAG: adenosine deaminase [Verrucomicrobiales bacterium]|jgi:adenosine deaminase